MSLKLTNSPPLPGMPWDWRRIQVRNEVTRKSGLRGSDHIQDTIKRDLDALGDVLRVLGHERMTGTMRVVIEPDKPVEIDGELTCYDPDAAARRDHILTLVGFEAVQIQLRYRTLIARCELELTQTLMFDPE